MVKTKTAIINKFWSFWNRNLHPSKWYDLQARIGGKLKNYFDGKGINRLDFPGWFKASILFQSFPTTWTCPIKASNSAHQAHHKTLRSWNWEKDRYLVDESWNLSPVCRDLNFSKVASPSCIEAIFSARDMKDEGRQYWKLWYVPTRLLRAKPCRPCSGEMQTLFINE